MDLNHFHDFPRFLGKSGKLSHHPLKLCASLGKGTKLVEQVIIVGGGMAGLACALTMRHQLPQPIPILTVLKAGETVDQAGSQGSFRKSRFFRCGSLVSAFSAFSVRFPGFGHTNQAGELPKTL